MKVQFSLTASQSYCEGEIIEQVMKSQCKCAAPNVNPHSIMAVNSFGARILHHAS